MHESALMIRMDRTDVMVGYRRWLAMRLGQVASMETERSARSASLNKRERKRGDGELSCSSPRKRVKMSSQGVLLSNLQLHGE